MVFKKVVPLHLTLLVFLKVSVRTSNDLGMREFDKYLNVYYFRVILLHFYGRLYALCYNLYSFSHFTLEYGFSTFLQVFAPFHPRFNP